VAVAASDDPYGTHAKDIIESYVTVCFLLGNDFLPHIPSLSLKHNGHARLLQAAKETWDALGVSPVAGGTINTKFFANLLRLLAKEEDAVFFKMNDEYIKKRPFQEPDPSTIYPDVYPIQKKNKDPLAYEISTMGTPAAWRTLYYKSLFHCRLYDTSIITMSSHLFVKGIFWTYSYYKRLPKDHEWLYPFNYAPTVLDLANYMQSSLSVWDALQATWSKTGTVTGFVTSPIQLMCILPIQSMHLLPKSYRAFMTDHTKGCTHMFPVKYPNQTYLKTHLWECTPVLPPLDTAWLQKCVQLYK
jgi:5'-3' exonuclease